ncbi:hypothetical protein [uncultured Methanobrevibacter sp.]|uniref:hypothetical protein n=1 Tax=uncultured Methanobrevibacter sp. TaxID=253161 RepID=UPI0025F8BDB0|nr:hypothetical protein [uncultured Methanobrevibacter sp.]
MNKKEPVRLYRADPRESILQNDLLIRISFTTLLILAFIIFVIVCFLLVPATHGFYWW